MPKIYIKNRDKLILCGLFLSKFDTLGLKKLGFSSFTEAFNVLGYALEAKAMNIKNYRDEFDPYFDNARIGWQRQMRDYCKVVFDEFKNLNLNEFADLILSFIVKNYALQKEILQLTKEAKDKAFLQRISTGKAAEGYFKANFKKHFENFNLTDTRELGCGFDFKLENKKEIICVEVKGLSENKGSFLLSEKEYKIAHQLQKQYCLFIVKNLKEKPNEVLFFNPTSTFNLKLLEQKLFSYQGQI